MWALSDEGRRILAGAYGGLWIAWRQQRLLRKLKRLSRKMEAAGITYSFLVVDITKWHTFDNLWGCEARRSLRNAQIEAGAEIWPDMRTIRRAVSAAAANRRKATLISIKGGRKQ